MAKSNKKQTVDQEETSVEQFATELPETDESSTENTESIDGITLENIESSDIAEQPVTLLIPYLKSAAAGDELKYALRAWERHLKNIKIVVVGDQEDYFSEKVIHISHERSSDNPQIDVAQKLILAIASGELGDSFVLTNDDIYPLGEIMIADIETLKAYGSLVHGVGKDGGVYNQNAIRTAKKLKEQGFPIHRYGTHTPMILKSKLLAEVIDLFEADSEGQLVTSLYFNTYFPSARPIQVNGGKDDPILASVYRDSVDPQTLKEVFAKRKFLNVNDRGWKVVKPILEKMYPEKSSFEK